jgi:hypothetical protein
MSILLYDVGGRLLCVEWFVQVEVHLAGVVEFESDDLSN